MRGSHPICYSRVLFWEEDGGKESQEVGILKEEEAKSGRTEKAILSGGGKLVERVGVPKKLTWPPSSHPHPRRDMRRLGDDGGGVSSDAA